MNPAKAVPAQSKDLHIKTRREVGVILAVLATVIFSAFAVMLRYDAKHYVEFETMSVSMLAARTGQPYLNLSLIPPVVYYTPLCYVLPALIGSLAGAAYDQKVFFLICRLTIFPFVLASVFIFWRITRQASRSSVIAALCLFVLVCPGWGVFSFRGDWSALFFSLCAFAFARSKIRPAAVLSGVFAATACLFCQRYISVTLAIFMGWLWMRRTRDVKYFCLAFGVTVLFILSFVSVLSGGLLWTHSFLLPAAVSSLTKKPFASFIASPTALLLVICAFFIFVRRFSRFERNEASLAALYSAIAVVVGSYFMMSNGADTNQLLESVVASTLALSYAYGEEDASLMTEAVKKLFFVVLVAIALWTSFSHLNAFRADLIGRRGQYDDTAIHDASIRRFVKGPLLSDSDAVAYRSGNPDAACEAWFFEGPLLKKGYFNPDDVTSKINSAHYATIVVRKDNSPFLRLFGSEIRSHYLPLREIGIYEIWGRKQAGDLSEAAS